MKIKSTNNEFITFINEYFTFSRMHRRGSLFLLLVILILCSGLYLVNFIKPNSTFNSFAFELEVKQFEAELAAAQKNIPTEPVTRSNEFKTDIIAEENSASVNLFPFDPNMTTQEEFIKLGLSEKQAFVISNYRNKGGRFLKKEDFRKMYCITSSTYLKLEPYISIPENTPEKTIFKKDSVYAVAELPAPLKIYDLNTINTANLDSIKGIGPAIATAIVNYREKLGGFLEISQLKEVFGVDSALYEKIKNRFTIETLVINKININQGFADDLKHPYLDRSLAKLIVNYRKFHGPFSQVADLHKLALVNEELYSKLAPYLCTK